MEASVMFGLKTLRCKDTAYVMKISAFFKDTHPMSILVFCSNPILRDVSLNP